MNTIKYFIQAVVLTAIISAPGVIYMLYVMKP